MDTVTAAWAIAPDDLARQLGRADTPLILDVRRPAAFAASPRLLPAAEHCPPEALEAWLRGRPPGTAVTVCVHGHGVSRDAAGRLRAAGWDARWLAGGIEGGENGVDAPEDLRRWRAAPLPRRFVDHGAQVAYVPAERGLDEARRRGAVAFDVAGAPIAHAGAACSFDALHAWCTEAP